MEELAKKLEEQDKKLEAIFRSVERMRKYFLWTFALSIVFFVLPLLGLVFVIPLFLRSLNIGALGL